jgi:glycosyltransferase involved in cell wall biosynthesis
MKIAHVTNYVMEGMDYQDTELPINQALLGEDITVYTSDRYYPFPNYGKSYLKLLGNRIVGASSYEVNGCKFVRMRPVFERVSMAGLLLPFGKLYKHLQTFSPDVIHLHGELNLNSIIVLFYCKLHSKKVFIDCHADKDNFPKAMSLKSKFLFFMFRLQYSFFKNQIKAFLPITLASKNYLCEKLRVKEPEMSILPLGSKLSAIRPRELDNEHEVVFVNSGKFYADKKIIENVLFVDLIAGKNPNRSFKLVLIGECIDDKYYQCLTEAIKGVSSNNLTIEFSGFVSKEELLNIYKSCHFGLWLGAPSNSIQDCFSMGAVVLLGGRETTSQLSLSGMLDMDADNLGKSATKFQENIFTEKNLLKIQMQTFKMISKYSWEQIARKSVDLYEKT